MLHGITGKPEMRLLSVGASWALCCFCIKRHNNLRLALGVSVTTKVPQEVDLNWGTGVGWSVCGGVVPRPEVPEGSDLGNSVGWAQGPEEAPRL